MAQTRREALNDVRWLAAWNRSDTDIPPFGLCRVTDVDSDHISLKVALPNAASDNCLYFAGPAGIKAGKGGAITKDFPGWALYEKADGLPVAGQLWGSVAGSAKLHRLSSGFVIFGVIDSTRGIVRAGCSCV